jgi:hypothetical protein
MAVVPDGVPMFSLKIVVANPVTPVKPSSKAVIMPVFNSRIGWFSLGVFIFVKVNLQSLIDCGFKS